METLITRLKSSIDEMHRVFAILSDHAITLKEGPLRWSKKEILGHLIDSAMNNIRRFNEVQFMPKPYVIQKYQQNELVQANHYQDAPLSHLLDLWSSLNRQVILIITHQNETTKAYPVITENGERTLEWLLTDYVDHLQHHLQQIKQDAVLSSMAPLYHLALEQAESLLKAQAPAEFLTLLSRGTLAVELYIPDGVDKQAPHEKDEVYVIISGRGTFIREQERYTFGPHDILFVPAGQEHRFVDFSHDFKTWVIFYGPKGGE